MAAAACSSLSCAWVTVCTSRGRLMRATSGCRRIVPVALHGASSSTASNSARRRPFGRVGVDHVRVQMPSLQIVGQALDPAGIALHGGDHRAGRGELCGLATGCGAQVGDALARLGSEQAGPAARRRHPAPKDHQPRSPGCRSPGCRRETHRSGRQAFAASGGVSTPGFRVTSSGASDWCAVAMARADWPQAVQSQAGVSRRGGSRSARASAPPVATLRSTALIRPENGARPRRLARLTAVATAAWTGRFQQQQARGADAQDVANRFRRFLAQKGLQHRVQRAHPAQHGSGEAMRGGAVPGVLRRQGVQRFFQRPVPFQHRGQQVEGGVACRISHQTGSIGRPMPW